MRRRICGPTSLAIAMNSLGVNDPTPPMPVSLIIWRPRQTVFTPANLAVRSCAAVDCGGMTSTAGPLCRRN